MRSFRFDQVSPKLTAVKILFTRISFVKKRSARSLDSRFTRESSGIREPLSSGSRLLICFSSRYAWRLFFSALVSSEKGFTEQEKRLIKSSFSEFQMV